MRQIKFRGKTPDGRIICGDLLQPVADGQFNPSIRAAQDNGGLWSLDYEEVLPETVAQLICVADKEYYEGDELIKDGRHWHGSLVIQWTEEIKCVR